MQDLSDKEIAKRGKAFIQNVVLCGLKAMYPLQEKPALQAIAVTAEKLCHVKAKTTFQTDPELAAAVEVAAGSKDSVAGDLVKIEGLAKSGCLGLQAAGIDAMDGEYSAESCFRDHCKQEKLNSNMKPQRSRQPARRKALA